MKKLYEYVIYFNPKDPTQSTAKMISKGITQVLANKPEEAQILAAREIPQEYLERLDEVVVAIRPF